jgi:phenylacetate-CoA ligase
MITELVVREPDGRVRTAKPGETGEVAITDLHNLACPMVRYITGDLAVQREHKPCACGRGLERIGPIEGRVTDTLRDGEGRPVNGLVFNILFGVMNHVALKFQVIQKLDGSVVMKVVPNGTPKLPEKESRQIHEFATKYLPGTKFGIEYVDDIPLTAAGKRKVVVVEKPAA